MSIPLPDSLADYFRHDNAHDADAVARCFSADAEVRDEGQVHQGREAIRSWKRATSERYGASARPVACSATPAGWLVAAEVTGNFPGSPLQIAFDFTVDEDAITALTIGA